MVITAYREYSHIISFPGFAMRQRLLITQKKSTVPSLITTCTNAQEVGAGVINAQMERLLRTAQSEEKVYNS